MPAVQPARRSFLNRLWLLLAAVGIVEVGVMLAYFFRPRTPDARHSGGDMRVSAGRVSDFLPGSVTAFPQGRFYLVRLADGGFLALSRQCTHLGCTVPWDADRQQFGCPCHASVFDMTGSVLNAPAPRPLDRFAVAIENEAITVDIRRRIQRAQFQESDICYAPNQAR
jgi:cytochrome b6-f complex iron-sulfur subunit